VTIKQDEIRALTPEQRGMYEEAIRVGASHDDALDAAGYYVLTCLNSGPDCAGPVEYRMALSSTGVAHPRCEAHWARRLEVEQGLQERYPVHAPADFDPAYAGERWEDD
jgi:hypothetical protein